jgi:cell wall-associated NlpC family hydrolase
VGLLLACLLFGGTVNSSVEAAPRARYNGKNHSTSVKKQVTNNGAGALGSPANEVVSDEAAVREALARRQAWNQSRTRSLEPAKVQDPPARQAEAGRADEPGRSASNEVTASHEPTAEQAPNEDLIREALRNRGTRYVWGGASRGGFDCSGFVCYLFKKMRGAQLPHSASGQSQLGKPVAREALQPGDLLFFSTYKPGISHVGIYIGQDRFIHAANSRQDVRIDTLGGGYYEHRFRWARRVSPAPMKFSPEVLKQVMGDASVLPDRQP